MKIDDKNKYGKKVLVCDVAGIPLLGNEKAGSELVRHIIMDFVDEKK